MSDNQFHAHLDKCAQCREHPFALCKATPEEVREAVAVGPVVYLSPEDFAILYQNPPKLWEVMLSRPLLQKGHFATAEDVRVFVSREIPMGYFLRHTEPDPKLNWQAPEGVRELKPKLDDWDYRLEPLLAPV